MAKRLLDRQISLLRYLTSSDAIYGGRDGEGAGLDPVLRDIERGLLDIEARFSHEKRMEKIVAVFRRTFELMDTRETLVKEFVEACPPVDIDRLVNARQFYDFLCVRTRHGASMPAYLADVARCELALATARIAAQDADCAERRQVAPGTDIRRRPAVELLRCAYDIRPLFEDNSGAAEPAKRDTYLAIVPQSPDASPQIFEIPAPVFQLLEALGDWTDPAAFADGSGDAAKLIAELVEARLVETRR